MDPESELQSPIWQGRILDGAAAPGIRPAPPTAHAALPLVEDLPPALSPWDVFLRLQGLSGVLFLDSALAHPALGRYSFLSAEPFAWIRARGNSVFFNDQPVARPLRDPLQLIEEQLRRFRAEPIPGLPPFQGGAAGLFGYDLCHHFERLPRPRRDEFEVPDLVIGLYDWVIAFDHVCGRSWLISTGFPKIDHRSRRRHAALRAQQVQARLHARAEQFSPRQPRLRDASPEGQTAIVELPGVSSSFTRSSYLDAVQRAIDYIYAGDCFQVNLAQRLLSPLIAPPLEIYRRLRERNAATFGGYFDLGDFIIASASPERFLRVDQGEVETRPIKGTRPRGADAGEDDLLVKELMASGKDRAENIMIVDLLRNDLGRVCRYGSVRVPALCRVETYGYVHHLVSEVRGLLRSECTPLDLLRAAFPGGSVTGAPKIRAMEIIAELEPAARGPYCGSLGYLGFDGSMDTNILIRTFVMGRGWIQFSVGGGIVADSVPEHEYQETWHKAEGMLRALHP